MQEIETARSPRREKLYQIIFGYETRAGRIFDLILIVTIASSVVAVLLDSVASISAAYHEELYALEWFFTLVFTLEYGLRLYSSPSPRGYATSFFGIVDLLSILPTYIAFLLPGAQSLIVIRVLRVLRIFRILKLVRFTGEANILLRAIVMSRHKIFIFLFSVMAVMVIFGALMYVVEGPDNGFTSIPASIYWAVVTVTTVGYGDITPHTILGQTISVLAMITGYAIIAVPTGIIGSELFSEVQRQGREARDRRICTNCNRQGHDSDAHFCKQCGAKLPD